VHGRMGAWFKQLAKPLLRDEPMTLLFPPSLPCACSFSSGISHRPARCVPFRSTRHGKLSSFKLHARLSAQARRGYLSIAPGSSEQDMN
jgi:hypothetical protein